MGNHLIRWHEEEYRLMAQTALAHDPTLKNATGAHLSDPDLWKMLMRALPEPRRRVLQGHHYPKLALHLRRTMAALPDAVPTAQEPAPAKRSGRARAGIAHESGRIFWSDEEYKVFALALHVMNPGADYLHSPDLAGLTTARLNIAAEVMPPDRRRHFPALEKPRQRLLEIYARAVREHDPMFFEEPQEAGGAPAPAAPAAVAEAQNPADQAEQPAPAAAAAAKGDGSHIHWTDDEWLAIARELDRLYPIRRFHAHPGSLGGLTPADVQFAQRVLPQDRQRPRSTLMSMPRLRKGLERGFSLLGTEKEKAAAAAAAPAPDAAVQVVEPAPAPNPWEAAFAPMVALLAEKVSAQVLGDLRPLLVAMATAANAPAASAPSQPSEQSALAAFRQERRADPGQPRRLHIGIFGNRNTYKDDLERHFPEIDFTCITSGRQIDSIRNCDKAIAMTKWMGHSEYKKLKHSVHKDRFMYVDGSLSELKRSITVLLHSGALQAKTELKAA